MIFYIILSIIILIIIGYITYKIKYGYWTKQPVFHYHNIFYWYNPPGVIEKGNVEISKYYNPQIEFIEGDGYEVIPELIEKHSDKKIGVFVDGPKYPGGLMLAESCFEDYENVMFTSLHDHTAKNYFNTHDEEFREIVGEMDKEMDHPQCGKYPMGSGLTIIC